MKKISIKKLPRMLTGDFTMMSTPLVKEIVTVINSQSEAIDSLQAQITELQTQLRDQHDKAMERIHEQQDQIKTVATSLRGVIQDE